MPKRRPTKSQYCWPHDTWTNNLILSQNIAVPKTNAVFCHQSISFSKPGLFYIVHASFMREQLFSFRRLQPRSCIIRHNGTRMRTEDNQKGRGKSTGPSFSAYGTYFAGAFFNMAAFFNCVYLYWVNRDFGWTYFRLIVNSIKFVFDEIKFRWKVFSIKFFFWWSEIFDENKFRRCKIFDRNEFSMKCIFDKKCFRGKVGVPISRVSLWRNAGGTRSPGWKTLC